LANVDLEKTEFKSLQTDRQTISNGNGFDQVLLRKLLNK
jgi:hypothetical protein